jgi:DNA-binding response OmpR family regulator
MEVSVRNPARLPLILLALPDDDEIEMYETHLTFAGYRVATAHTVSEARDKAHGLAPDVLVIGQRLRPDGGEQVCRELKAQSAFAQVPAVIITSYRAAPCSCDLTLVRPVVPQVLTDAITLLIKKAVHTK